MSKLYKKAIVQKRNILNEIRSNNMTLQELRFFSIYLSKINPQDVSTRVVRFPLSDFQKLMELGTDMNISHFKLTVRRILQQVVEVPNENKSGYRAFQLFKEAIIDKDENDEWYVEFDAHDKSLPLMFDFKNKYFKYELWNALRLKSPNQVRMYEILKQYEGLKKRELSVEELRELLGIAKNEYFGRTGWSDFKKKVLDSCQQALKETTDIFYTYERGKVGKGGKWLSIIFYIEKNTSYKDQITLEQFLEMQPKTEPDYFNDQSKNLPEHLSFTDTYSDYEKDLIFEDEYEPVNYCSKLANLLDETCNNEFTPKQIRILQDIILQYVGQDYVKCSDYLTHKLNITNLYANKKDRESRFRYLLTMINNDIKDPDNAL